jgi:hypothetical protein
VYDLRLLSPDVDEGVVAVYGVQPLPETGMFPLPQIPYNCWGFVFSCAKCDCLIGLPNLTISLGDNSNGTIEGWTGMAGLFV